MTENQSLRVVRVCQECQTRVFDNPTWKCAQHPSKTITQTNRPYMQEKRKGRKG